jgi:hypothetical protein
MNENFELNNTEGMPATSPLGGLNQLFHNQYQRWQEKAAKEIKEGAVPIVIRLDDRLILNHGEHQHVYQINGDRHHELKALSHLPLVVYLTLADTEKNIKDLTQIRVELEKTQAMLNTLHHYIEPIRLAISNLSDSIKVNEGVMAYDAVIEYARFLKPTFQKMIENAANDEVEQLMSAMLSIKTQVGDEHCWAETFFVICGGHQPRYKQITKLFFERWLMRETKDNMEALHRVIYAESCKTLEEALKLVTSRMVSAKLGDLFLHSPLSLDEDVLGDAGKAAIDRLFYATAGC